MDTVKALLLFSHGSTLCGSGEALNRHAESLRRTPDYPIVQIGYLNYTSPLFPNAVASLVAQGVTDIVVVPFFLISGYFVTNSLPKEIANAVALYPHLKFTIADALMQDDLLVDAILESAQQAQSAEAWREPLRRATQFCRPVPECPLYGTSACPKMPVAPQREAV